MIRRPGTCLCVMANSGKKVEAKAPLHTSCTSSSLCSVAFGDKSLHKSADLPLFIKPGKGMSYAGRNTKCAQNKPHLPVLPCVNDTCDIGNCDTSLSNVGR